MAVSKGPENNIEVDQVKEQISKDKSDRAIQTLTVSLSMNNQQSKARDIEF